MPGLGDRCGMLKRVAVLFGEGEGTTVPGSLVVEPDRLLLSGGSGLRRFDLAVAFASVADVRVGRRPAERLSGHATLVLDRNGMPSVRVAPLGAGLVHEVADLVGQLCSQRRAGTQELVVVVPLKAGCLERARALLAEGP